MHRRLIIINNSSYYACYSIYDDIIGIMTLSIPPSVTRFSGALHLYDEPAPLRLSAPDMPLDGWNLLLHVSLTFLTVRFEIDGHVAFGRPGCSQAATWPPEIPKKERIPDIRSYPQKNKIVPIIIYHAFHVYFSQ